MNQQTETEEPVRMTMTEARLLDLRTYIAVLMLIFGVVVTGMGIVAGDEDVAKAVNVNINLWSGIGMLAISAFFIVWALVKPPIPLGAEPEKEVSTST